MCYVFSEEDNYVAEDVHGFARLVDVEGNISVEIADDGVEIADDDDSDVEEDDADDDNVHLEYDKGNYKGTNYIMKYLIVNNM